MMWLLFVAVKMC